MINTKFYSKIYCLGAMKKKSNFFLKTTNLPTVDVLLQRCFVTEIFCY
jgi:hypothetical protein